jgi:cell shape-determining protein MreD
MGLLVLFAWSVLASAVPDAAPSWLAIDRHAPDLWAALAVWLGTRAQSHGVTGWAALLGAWKDATSLDPMGTHAFVLAAVAFVFVRKRGAPAQGAALGLAVLLGTLLAQGLYVLRSVPLPREQPSAGTLFAHLLAGFPCALWTALLAWPLLTLLDRTRALDDVIGRRRGLPA